MFYVVRAVLQFDFRIVINETPNKWWPAHKSWRYTDPYFWQDLYVFYRLRKCYGTLPTLCRSTAFSWV